MIHFVIIIDFLTATLNKKYIRVKQKNPPQRSSCEGLIVGATYLYLGAAGQSFFLSQP